jgi:hypothetical protein
MLLVQARDDLEAADIGKLDVEQDEVGRQLCRQRECGLAVFCLTDDLEPFRGQERSEATPEARMVVDDENPPSPLHVLLEQLRALRLHRLKPPSRQVTR